MRRFVHEFLKWFPVAIFGGALAAAGVWTEVKDWIAALVAFAWSEMTYPWIAFFALASVAAYVAAIIWTGQERKPVATSYNLDNLNKLSRALGVDIKPQEKLALENGLALQKSRREAIADCRKMIAEWGGNHSHYDQRAAMEASPSFLLLDSHFSQHFSDYLARNALGTIDPGRHHRPMAMAALATQLDRLEEEWGLT